MLDENKENNIKDKSVEQQNERRLKTIYDELAFLACSEDNEATIEHEKLLISEILKLSPDHKEDNSPLTQELHLYLAGLFHKGRLSLDSTVHNTSIELFTEAFLNYPLEIKRRFYFISLQKVMQMLILANLSIHRVQHADELLNKYEEIFFDTYKAMLYMRILTATCGKLDIGKIKTLFSNAANTYDNECSSIENKANFLTNIYMLSKGTGETVPQMEYMLNDLFDKLEGDCNGYAVSFFTELCYCKEHVDEIGKWLNSVNRDEATPDRIADVEAMHKSIVKGVDEIKKIKIAQNPPEDTLNSLLWDIRKNISDRDYPLKKLSEEIDNAIKEYEQCAMTDINIDEKLTASDFEHILKLMKPSVSYWRDYENNLLKVKPSDTNSNDKDKVFFFVNEDSLVNGAVSFPFLLEARRRGISCYSISPHIHLDSAEVNDEVSKLYGFVVSGLDTQYYPDKQISDAEIDIKNKKIIVKGMNIYQPIFELVTRYQFTYSFNYDTDAWARYRTILLIRKFKSLFEYIERIEKWAIENSKEVYFISNAPHIHNAAAFRIYCEEKGFKNGLFFICTSPGYDNYFANAADPRTETTTALNLTTHKHARNSFLGTEEGFKDYYESNHYRIAEIREKMQKHLEAQRGRKGEYQNPDEKNKVLNYIKDSKAQGKKIILLNGKVIIDLAVKYTKGVVHSDMSEWITHAVVFAKAHSDEILLLIKPHPHENREDLTLTSEKIDNLKSLIKTELGDNTVYLDNDMFTNHELTDYIDLGMVWNGTSALEFAAQGIKVLVADIWGHYDYPIGFAQPKSLAEYENYLLNPELIREPDDISDRAISFLEYMGSEEVRIPNHYSETTLMNFNQYESTVNEEAVDCFAETGDPVLARYFDRLMERSTIVRGRA